MKSAQQLYEFFSTFPLNFWNYCTPRASYVEKLLWVRFQTTSENDGGLLLAYYYLNSLYFYAVLLCIQRGWFKIMRIIRLLLWELTF